MRHSIFDTPGRDYSVKPQATEVENPVTHTLLGPKGETIRQWRERPVVEFGFRPPASTQESSE